MYINFSCVCCDSIFRIDEATLLKGKIEFDKSSSIQGIAGICNICAEIMIENLVIVSDRGAVITLENNWKSTMTAFIEKELYLLMKENLKK